MHVLNQENLPFFVVIFILLIVARIFGELAERIRIPSMIGEIIAGIILGPSILGWIHFDNDLKVFQ